MFCGTCFCVGFIWGDRLSRGSVRRIAFAGENGAIVGAFVSVVAIAMLLGKLLR